LLAAFIIASASLSGYRTTHELATDVVEREARRVFRPALVHFIRQQHEKRGELTVASRWVQQMWLYTPGVNYHSHLDVTSLDDLIAMFDHLHVDYLVVPTWAKSRFLEDRAAFDRNFGRIARRHDCYIYERRKSAPP
jgi:hypothetical protein